MAAPREARFAVAKISKLLACSRIQPSSYLVLSRYMGFMDKLRFGRAEKGEDIVTMDERDQPQIVPGREFRKRLSIEEVRAYIPPTNATVMLEAVAHECLDDVTDVDDWTQIKLIDRMQKFEFLTRAMEVLDHDIPNMDLHNMNTVEDVVKYFTTEVKDSSTLEDMSKLDLPKNLHLNQEYIRFHPDTDKIYDGVSAFPGIPTHVSSVKFKRKYKGYDGGDPINNPEQFTKEN